MVNHFLEFLEKKEASLLDAFLFERQQRTLTKGDNNNTTVPKSSLIAV
jgi:hypothetical protein